MSILRRHRAASTLKRATRPAWLAEAALVIALMLASAAAAAWLTLQAVPAQQAAELRAAEDAAFEAGRLVTYAELSKAMAQVYEQGRAEGMREQAGQAAADARGDTRGATR